MDLLIVAGEHSGDEHAAEVLRDMKQRRPDLKVACLGGVELQAAGAQLLYDLTAVSIVGLFEVIKHYGFFKGLFQRTLDWIAQYRPKHICFVDYPGFNLRLAEELRRRGLSRKGGGAIAVSYYIGPQIWAWKAGRRFKMAKALDRLGVIFPFEVDCYKDTDLPVEFVGHPFVRQDYQPPFTYDATAPVLLLPGSRRAAVERIFPMLLSGFRQALQSKPGLSARVIYPTAAIREILEACLEHEADLRDRIELVPNEEQTMPASGVLMSSGTMSLSVAMSGIPGAITYRLHPMTYWLGRMIMQVPYLGISNLLLERPLHPEFLQGAATPEALAGAILRIESDASVVAEAREGARQLREILQPDSRASAAEWLLKEL